MCNALLFALSREHTVCMVRNGMVSTRVFIVGTNRDAAACALEVYNTCDVTPAPTRRWEMMLCHLVHGQAYDQIEAALKLQSFSLFYGYPWSHPQCQQEMRRRFPDAVWVRAPVRDELRPCVNDDCCVMEEAEFQYDSLAAVRAALPPRVDRPAGVFPCACTVVKLVDESNVWSCAPYPADRTDIACFSSSPSGSDEDVHIYIH